MYKIRKKSRKRIPFTIILKFYEYTNTRHNCETVDNILFCKENNGKKSRISIAKLQRSTVFNLLGLVTSAATFHISSGFNRRKMVHLY